MRARNPVQPGRRLGVPIQAWPCADQLAWKAAFAAHSEFDDILDGGPLGAHLRRPSQDTMATCYSRWLLYVTAHHLEMLAVSPADRATEDRVIGYLHSLRAEVTLRTLYNYACRLKRALQLLAPQKDWSWFVPILRRLERRARAAPSSPRPFVHSRDLFEFGLEVMNKAQLHTSMTVQARAEEYRNGLMLSFLAARPIRLRNMTELQIGSQLVETADGYRVIIPRTKTGTGLEFPVPTRLVPYMARYLSEHRAVLCAGPYGAAAGYPEQGRFLWLARSGAQFPPDSFGEMVTRRTTERFQIRLTPHGFRHCAATTIAENDPEEFHIIRIILGHATMDTADKHYVHAKGIDATRKVQALIIRTRQGVT